MIRIQIGKNYWDLEGKVRKSIIGPIGFFQLKNIGEYFQFKA